MTRARSKAKDPTGASSPSVAPSRYRTRHTVVRDALPYVAIGPAFLTFVVLLGYPVLLLFETSMQNFGLYEILNHVTTWIGVQNYYDVLFNSPAGLPDFFTVLVRTTLFMAVNVALTVFLGTLVALLLAKLNKWVRLLLTSAMVLAWAMPVVTGAVLFQWLFDSKLGVVNWALSSLDGVINWFTGWVGIHGVVVFGNYLNHSWFDTGLTTFGVVTLLIVWQAIPFVALSLYAGILSIAKELPEAARVDGANERQIFRNITLPSLAPLLLMLIFLSVIWDFKVFTQIYAMRQGGPDGQTITLSLYSYIVGISQQQYGYAAAASVIMMLLLLVVLVPYLRRMIKSQEEL
jgi:N,N'-diacetylchitobiose transport system permease protein